MDIPHEVRQEASELINMYGECFTLIGANEMGDIYKFDFPGEECIGFPFLYIYNPLKHTVKVYTGIDGLDIISKTNEI